MKEESLIPEPLREAFKNFSSLKSDAEKKTFWIELAKSLKGVSPETLNQLLKEGLSTLSDAVDKLDDKVKKHLPA